MIKVKVTLGATYVGCKAATVEFECDNMEEFKSDRFSTEILNSILFDEFSHYFIDIETEEIDDEDE
jgi:hypothetical protein